MVAVDSVITRARGETIERRSRFFLWLSIAMAVAVFLGFAPSFYLRAFVPPPPNAPPLTHLLQLHGALFTTWMLLVVAQSSLIAARRVAVHRALGVAGAALATAMVVVASMVDIAAPNSRWDAWLAARPTMAANVLRFAGGATGPLIAFGLLVAAAVYWRGRPQAHKRLIVLASFALLPAALARFAAVSSGIAGFGPPVGGALGWLAFHGVLSVTTLPFFAALAIHDLRTFKRLHPATVWGAAVLYLPNAVAAALLLQTPALRASLGG